MNALNEFRLYLKLRPGLARLKELSHLKLSVNVIGQGLLVLLQMGNQVSGFVPDSKKFYLAAALGCIQMIVSVLAHYSNPNGTPSALPYGLSESDLAQYRRIFGSVSKIIVLVVLGLAIAAPSRAQAAYTPNVLVTGGGGFASPNGKFGFESISKLTGPQDTYLTQVQEFTIAKGQVETCSFIGATKSLYRWSFVTIGLTGVGGGCNSTTGSSAPAGSGQGFALVRIRKSPFGLVFTALKNTSGGYKITAGMSWGIQEPVK